MSNWKRNEILTSCLSLAAIVVSIVTAYFTLRDRTGLHAQVVGAEFVRLDQLRVSLAIANTGNRPAVFLHALHRFSAKSDGDGAWGNVSDEKEIPVVIPGNDVRVISTILLLKDLYPNYDSGADVILSDGEKGKAFYCALAIDTLDHEGALHSTTSKPFALLKLARNHWSGTTALDAGVIDLLASRATKSGPWFLPVDGSSD